MSGVNGGIKNEDLRQNLKPSWGVFLIQLVAFDGLLKKEQWPELYSRPEKN